MFRYAAQRVLLMVVTLIGVVTITFVLGRVLPGSPVELMIGYRPTQAQIEAVTHQLGLDLPMHEQYIRFIGEAIRGDFGISLHTKQPVISDIAIRSMSTRAKPRDDTTPLFHARITLSCLAILLDYQMV